MPGADFRGTAGNAGQGIVIADGFQTGSGVSGARTIRNTTVTFDPPSLTTGAFATSSAIPVTGIALGDDIELFPPYGTQGIMFKAVPSSAGNMVINLFNTSASTVDLASGTWGVIVKRRS
ncbi:hypothetical protein D3C71_1035450 [compost metagenome]